MENMTAKKNVPPQRVDKPLTLEGVPWGQRVGLSPLITPTPNSTAPVVIQNVPYTHQRIVRHTTPRITLAINIRTGNTHVDIAAAQPSVGTRSPTCTIVPNSNCIPFFLHHNMISQESADLVTQRVCDTPGEEWIPRDLLDHSPTERATQEKCYKFDINRFCKIMVHLDTR